MARVAFVMDRIFRSLPAFPCKSLSPCRRPPAAACRAVLATKTIENEKDRRMTVMTTTFIPCGAKLPVIALVMGALIGDAESTWIAPLFYFLGVIAVIVSGIMLKKTKLFAGRPTPFVMELPSYHMPSARSWALHVWERVSAYVKKAFTIIFASTIVVWFLRVNFGLFNGVFRLTCPLWRAFPEEFTDYSLLASLAGLLAWALRAASASILGRQRPCPSRAWSPRRTSWPPRRRFCIWQMLPRPTPARGPRSPRSSPAPAPSPPSAPSTCCAPRASLPWAPFAPR